MGRDVGIRVPLETRGLVGEVQPREMHGYAVGEAVDVGADADAREAHRTIISYP